VATAVVAATLTSVIVFAPIIVTQDSSGIMTYLAQVGITISVALLFSLLISLTLIPFLTSRLLKPKKLKPSKLLQRIEDRYVRILGWTTAKRPFLTGFIIVVAVTAITTSAFTVFKLDFNMREGILIENLYISYDFTENLTYDQTEHYVNAVEEVLADKKEELGVTKVYSYYQTNFAATTVYFDDKYLNEEKLQETRDSLRVALPELAGCSFRFGDDQGGGSGGVETIEVSLFGEDMTLLDEYSQEVKRRLSLLEGMEDVRTSIEMGSEEIKIALKRDLANQYGISPQTVSGIMNLTFRGMQLRRFQTPDREVPMEISLSPEDKVGLYNLKNLLVGMSDGRDMTLGTVADLTVSRGPTTIRRNAQKASVSISGAYDREKNKELRDKVVAVMNSIQLPFGYSWSFGREFQRQQEQNMDMLFNVLLALICVYLVMAALFESLLHPLIIMMCLPFSLVGVVLALLITGTAVNMMAMIGGVILIGIVVNNGIVLIDHVNNFRRQGNTVYEAILKGGRERFRPIVMTACTTILGLLPMAIGKTNVAGMQYYPLARAVIGGLAMGTILTLIALPTFYVIGERQKHWAKRVWARAKQPRRAASDTPS
jgi:HAE1 family hydrophobic/amphiphilic exporter-1